VALCAAVPLWLRVLLFPCGPVCCCSPVAPCAAVPLALLDARLVLGVRGLCAQSYCSVSQQLSPVPASGSILSHWFLRLRCRAQNQELWML